MTRMRLRPRFLRSKRLTREELASLREVAMKPTQRSIPDAHRDRLIKAGYVREMVGRWSGISTLALTGAGIRRLESEK